MSTYYEDQATLWASVAPSGSQPGLQTMRWTIVPIMLAIIVGNFGREWTWLQQIPGLIAAPPMIMSGIILWWVAGAMGALGSENSRMLKRYVFLIWFVVCVALERAYSALGQMPLDRHTLQVIFSYITSVAGVFIGLKLGTDSETSRLFLKRAALVFAVFSLLSFTLGSPPSDEEVAFPSSYVGFPVRLFCIFPLCWYFDAWLRGNRILSLSLVGVGVSALASIVAFHKPIVFSAVAGLLVLCAVRLAHDVLSGAYGSRPWLARRVLLIMVRLVLLGGVSLYGFTVADRSSGGELSDSYMDVIYKKFLHSTRSEVRTMSWDELRERFMGGRAKVWDIAGDRLTESPIFGTGLGQRVAGSLSGGNVIPIHNQYLSILLAVGVLGSVPVALALLFAAVYTFRRLRSDDSDWVVPVVGFVTGMAAYNMGGTSELFPFVSAFTFICVGMLCARPVWQTPPQDELARMPQMT